MSCILEEVCTLLRREGVETLPDRGRRRVRMVGEASKAAILYTRLEMSQKCQEQPTWALDRQPRLPKSIEQMFAGSRILGAELHDPVLAPVTRVVTFGCPWQAPNAL